MRRLIYSMFVSLDGYIADADGRIDWSEPDEQVHSFVNRRQAAIGGELYGRRPVVVGGGTPFFPPLERRIRLRLAESRTFDSGVCYRRYLPVTS